MHILCTAWREAKASMKSVLIHFLVDVGYNYSSSYIFNLSSAATCRIYVLFMTSIIILLNTFSFHLDSSVYTSPSQLFWYWKKCIFYNDKTCFYHILKSKHDLFFLEQSQVILQHHLVLIVSSLLLFVFLGRQRSRTPGSQ